MSILGMGGGNPSGGGGDESAMFVRPAARIFSDAFASAETTIDATSISSHLVTTSRGAVQDTHKRTG
jgi:hypothetical protein